MNELNCLKDIYAKIESKKWIMLYLSKPDCGVCKSLLPKIEKLSNKYPKMDLYYADITNDEKISGQLSIFTIPGILVFIDGMEVIREARYISIQNLTESLNRIQNILETK